MVVRETYDESIITKFCQLNGNRVVLKMICDCVLLRVVAPDYCLFIYFYYPLGFNYRIKIKISAIENYMCTYFRS